MEAIYSKHILLDSCVVEYLLSTNKSLANKVGDQLAELRKNGKSLYISELTYFELLRDISDENKEKANITLQSFIKIPVTDERIKKATVLYGRYKKHQSISKYLQSISDCDVLIGSLIFNKYQPLLLTADYWDFPRPFFVEKKIERIEYLKKRKGQKGDIKSSIYFYYLGADLKTLLDQ